MKPEDQNRTPSAENTVSMIEHQAFDAAFQELYEKGMALIEETAAYIDGDGHRATRNLSDKASALYTSEAMRVSTRLMQVASWLLLMRAGREKEMSEEQIALEKAKVSLDTPSEHANKQEWHELPEAFRNLVEQSLRLEERVRYLDNTLAQWLQNEEKPDNPVTKQIDLLHAAFGRR